ncbi:MAG: DUF1727 domain-containing protein [Oscillospiraceae bacterium]|nr:DUF1727 domain-containing protein [Oscillospiraceae bacterium]
MLRFFIAFILGKLTAVACRAAGVVSHRNGTNLPGAVALRICPDFLDRIGKPDTVIAVTGTNGKTTTTNMAADALEHVGYTVLSNRLGSNINSGIATCLLSGAGLGNRSRYRIAVLEVDERSSLLIYPSLKPDYIVCTNLTRDSFRRNAHPHFIFDIMESAIPDGSTLILNSDDIISSALKRDNPRVYYAIDRQPDDKTEPFNLVNDMRICPRCRHSLEYDYVRYNHIGSVHCPNCSLRSPEADYHGAAIDRQKNTLTVTHAGESEEYRLLSPRVYNIYNQLAVITLLRVLGIPCDKVKAALDDTHIVNSRFSSETVGGINITTTMTKGWIGTAVSVAFDAVRSAPGQKELVLMLEDTFDNERSSENLCFIYESDFEFLNIPELERIVFTGVRANDFMLRMLLAGIDPNRLCLVHSIDDIAGALSLKPGTQLHIVYCMHQRRAYERVLKSIRERIDGGEAL